MVIHQINIERVTVKKTKNNSPVARYRNAPCALKAALESVETIARQVEIGRPLRSIQVTQNVRDPAHPISSDFAWVALLEQAL